MPLSIRDIIDTPALATRLLCGAAGLERPVRWAHVCELDDPSEWLGEGDLLMTTGLGLPDTPAAQQAYVERLAEARLSGIMIGEHMQAPANLEALCAAAEAHGLPVLMTRYSVHFSAVTRRVIEAGKREEFERLATINRLYESARLGLRGLGTAALLERLGRDLHCRLYVLETGSLEPWLPGLPAVEPALQARLGQRLQQQRGSPTHVLRVAVDGQSAWWQLLPEPAGCALLACGEGQLDYGLLHHLAGVIGLELARLQAEQDRHLQLGSELLDDLLARRLPEAAARSRLALLHCSLDGAVLALADAAACAPDWPQRLQRLGLRFLGRRLGALQCLLLGDPATAAAVQAVLGCPLGVSEPLAQAQRLAEAQREARLALAHAGEQGGLIHYSHLQLGQPWLPDSLEQAAQVQHRVLGAVLEHDREHANALLPSLRVFLEHNRSWQRAAAQLSIHKQTLVYRMQRIEALTGRSLSNTGDVAVLWIALQAGDLLA